MSKPIIITKNGGNVYVRLGPFYEADGVTLATSLAEGTQFVIMGINLAQPAPIQRPLQSDRPPMFSGEAGHFWVPLIPEDTDDLRGLAVVWCPEYDVQTDLQILAPGDYVQATPSPRQYYNLALADMVEARQIDTEGLGSLSLEIEIPTPTPGGPDRSHPPAGRLGQDCPAHHWPGVDRNRPEDRSGMNTQTGAMPATVHIYNPAPDRVCIVWRPCPDCSEDDRKRPFVYAHTPWLGGHGTCLTCGTVINGDGAQVRGGGVGWRQRNKANALQAWQRYNTPDHRRQWAMP